MEEYLADLVPVSEWDWYLYRVDYLNAGGGVIKTLHLVSTPTHIADEVQRQPPNSFWVEVTWTELRKVDRPRITGSLNGFHYSVPIHETAREAGEREIKQGV